jgi:LysR family positive regulator for ilvC
MDFRTLSLFAHLAHTLHFANTANQMAVSPSTLSRTMQRLEQETGCALFERDNRSVVLTSEGKQLLSFAERWLQEWQDLRDDLRHPREALQGRIRVYCSVTASYFLLPGLLGRFRHRYPQLELKLETGDAALAVDKVLQEETDIAIAARPDALPNRLQYCLLQQVPLVFIAPRVSNNVSQWLKEGEPDWSQVPLIVSQQGLARKRCDQWFRNKGISPNIYAEVAGNEAIVSMVALDCGVGLVPEAVIDHSPLGAQVRVIQPAPALKPFEVGLCVQKKRLDEPLIQAFWQMAQQ